MGHYLSEMGNWCKKHEESYVHSCSGCDAENVRESRREKPATLATIRKKIDAVSHFSQDMWIGEALEEILKYLEQLEGNK